MASITQPSMHMFMIDILGREDMALTQDTLLKFSRTIALMARGSYSNVMLGLGAINFTPEKDVQLQVIFMHTN